MKIRYWGVRGSIPTPGPDTVKYGGNTPCVSVETENSFVIFDAGTGIRLCGNYLLSKGGPVKGAIFISHTHWDHIQGFPFFVPAYIPGNAFMMYGPPSDVRDRSLKDIMDFQTSHEYFPVSIRELGADIAYIDCKGQVVKGDDYEVHTCRLNHPVTCFAYKIISGGKTFIYGGDHEPFRNIYRDYEDSKDMDEEVLETLDNDAVEQNKRVDEFCRGADLVSWDSMYSEEEYQSKKGWGHSYYERNLAFAKEADIKQVVFSHHDPMSPDSKLEKIEAEYVSKAKGLGIILDFAKEGMEIEL